MSDREKMEVQPRDTKQVLEFPSRSDNQEPSEGVKKKQLTDTLVALLNTAPSEVARDAYIAAGNKIDQQHGLSVKMTDTAIAESLRERFAELAHLSRHPDSNDLWRYNGELWERVDDDDAIALVTQILSENTFTGVNSNKAKGVLTALCNLSGKRPLRQAGMVAFRNGVYNARTREFFQHSPEFGIENVVPCDFSTMPKIPSRFIQFIKESCGDREDRELMMLAQYKYHLENRTFDQIYFENIGDGGCGLSTHQAVLSAMLGDEGVAATDLHSVDGKDADQHATSEFVGKTAWLIPDAKEIASSCTNLKAITGEDEVRIREVFKKGYKTVLPMTVSYFGNQPIINMDRSGGLNRRRNVIKLDQVVTPEMKDPYLKEKLIAELSGIIAYVQDNLPDEKYYEILKAAKHGTDKMTVISETESLSGWIMSSLKLSFNEQDATPIGSLIDWRKDNLSRRLERAKSKLFENYLLYCEIVGIENPIKRGFDKALIDTINLKLSATGQRVKKARTRANSDKHPSSCIIGAKIIQSAEHLHMASDRVDEVERWSIAES